MIYLSSGITFIKSGDNSTFPPGVQSSSNSSAILNLRTIDSYPSSYIANKK